MTGRGIDQVLPVPSDSELRESYVRDALQYVGLAEQVSGTIPAPVDFDYVWGDALHELERAAPDLRIINLETSVTTSDEWEPKGINYRMHPGNIPCLTAARIDCCGLANNHVLDFGRRGLEETLEVVRAAGIRTVGAGHDDEAAWRPAVFQVGETRVLVFAFAAQDSGVPRSWSAGAGQPGLAYLGDLSTATADRVADHVLGFRRDGDLVVVSIHWGGNWGYDVPSSHRSFAHRIIDEGAADVVYGHSSHHPRGIEVRGGRPILYGCGDFVNDYEGISGYEEYRDELALMYFVTLGASGLERLRLVPMRRRRFRLQRASEREARWLQRTIQQASERFGTQIDRAADGSLLIGWS